VLRVLVGGLVVAAGAMAAHHGHVFAFDANLFRLVNELPEALGRPLLAVMQLGAVAAVPAIAAVALVARRPRLARDLVLSGGMAWRTAERVVGGAGLVLLGVIVAGAAAALLHRRRRGHRGRPAPERPVDR
jgi:hypothetical protein